MSGTYQSVQATTSGTGYSPAQINAFFLELDRLLERIESGSTHYQVLGVDREIRRDAVRVAYQQALDFLFPSSQISEALPPQMTGRIDQALEKLSQAFAILGSFSRRQEYDQALTNGRPQAPVIMRPPVNAPAIPVSPPPVSSPPVAPGSVLEAPAVPVSPPPKPKGEVTIVFQHERDLRNRRRNQRSRMSLPISVIGHDRRGGPWEELTETIDVSRTGVMITLPRSVRLGAVLYLSLPMPAALRPPGVMEDEWKVYAIVRRVRPGREGREGRRTVGLEFIGGKPPAGYNETPWAAFRTKRWVGVNRRLHERVNRNETVFLEFLDENGLAVLLDTGVTENISRTGTRIRIKPVTARFELVNISSWDRKFNHKAAVVDRFLGADGDERLCLHFIEKEYQF